MRYYAYNKAKELVEKFIEPTRVPVIKYIGVEYIDSSKQCALIVVDEVLNELFEIALVTGSSYIHKHINYYQEVKQEIEKL